MNTLKILSGGAAQGLVGSLAAKFKTLTGFDIAEVIEKPVHFGKAVQVPVQRCPDPLHNLRMRQVAAAVGDAQCG